MGWKLQEQALSTKGLEPTEKLALIALASFANEETRECWPSQKKISEICERTEKRVNQLIGLLCDKGLVTQIGRHGPTIKYKVFPSKGDLANGIAAREGRKRKYHAAAAERGKKIKENNKKKRDVKAAGHPMDGISGHPMDGISGHPMDGIQTDKKNLKENLLSNQEDKKENIIRQDNLLGSNIEAHPKVSSDDAELKNDFDFDSQDTFKRFLDEIAAELAKQGMGKREVTLRLANTHNSYLEIASDARQRGWRKPNNEKIDNPKCWCKGLWRKKAFEYSGADLSAEDLLEIVKEHYYKIYPNAHTSVDEVLADDCGKRLDVEATAGAWEVVGVEKPIPYVIKMFEQPMAAVCS